MKTIIIIFQKHNINLPQNKYLYLFIFHIFGVLIIWQTNKFQYCKVLIWIWNPLLIAHLTNLMKVEDSKTIQIFLKTLPCSREKNSEIHILYFQSTSIILKTNLSSSSMISHCWIKVIRLATTYLFRINFKQSKKEKLNSKLMKLQFKSS